MVNAWIFLCPPNLAVACNQWLTSVRVQKPSCSVASRQTQSCSLLSRAPCQDQAEAEALLIITPLVGSLTFPNLLPPCPSWFLLEPFPNKSCSPNSLAHLKHMASGRQQRKPYTQSQESWVPFPLCRILAVWCLYCCVTLLGLLVPLWTFGNHRCGKDGRRLHMWMCPVACNCYAIPSRHGSKCTVPRISDQRYVGSSGNPSFGWEDSSRKELAAYFAFCCYFQ